MLTYIRYFVTMYIGHKLKQKDNKMKRLIIFAALMPFILVELVLKVLIFLAMLIATVIGLTAHSVIDQSKVVKSYKE